MKIHTEARTSVNTHVVVPDKIAPEIGWRAWSVVYHRKKGFRLHSVGRSRVEWPTRKELRARCLRHLSPDPSTESSSDRFNSLHPAPDENCGPYGCGIYATKRMDDCIKYLPFPGLVDSGVSIKIFGKVALWGKTLEAERGWRAEFAYPEKILIPPNRYILCGPRVGETEPPPIPPHDIAYGLSEYGVPIEQIGSLDELHHLIGKPKPAGYGPY